MSNVVNLLTKEQAILLQEICDTMDSALCDTRSLYTTRITDENGTRDCLSSREEFLEHIMDWALNTLGATFDFLE